jgi:hypothetical protein
MPTSSNRLLSLLYLSQFSGNGFQRQTSRQSPLRKHRFPLLLYAIVVVKTCLFAKLLYSSLSHSYYLAAGLRAVIYIKMKSICSFARLYESAPLHLFGPNLADCREIPWGGFRRLKACMGSSPSHFISPLLPL